MPRNMSFALTTAQFLDRSKTVTRRNGWKHAKAGDIVQGVRKSQGIPKGGKIERLGLIRLTDVRREALRRIIDDLDYGFAETTKEGFPEPHPKHFPTVFVEYFCGSHRGVTLDSEITRIEFEHVE